MRVRGGVREGVRVRVGGKGRVREGVRVRVGVKGRGEGGGEGEGWG